MHRWLVALAILALSAALAQDNPALVRFAQLVQGAPLMEVRAGEARLFEGQFYRSVTSYEPVPGGQVTVRVQTEGQRPALLGSLSFAAQPGKRYTVMAVGTAAAPQVRWLEDPVLPLPAANAIKIRLIHAAPDLPALDLTYKEGPVLLRGVEFAGASAYRAMPPSRYYLDLRPSGTAEVALSIEEATLEGGKVYSVFVTGRRADESLDFLIMDDSFSP